LALGGLCPLAVQDFDDGVLPLKHAVYLAKFFSPDAQMQICREALAFHYNERKYGAVSFKIFREEVEEQFVRRLANAPFDTEDERLHLAGTTVSPRCSICPQRTGFNTLFKEISAEDCCLNRECFQFKTNVHLRLQREAIAAQKIFATDQSIEEALRDVPLVTERKYVSAPPPFKEKVKTEVEFYDAPECDSSTLALAVEGAKKGQKVWICAKKESGENCEVHNPAAPPEKPDRETLERREREINERVRASLREKIFSRAIQCFDDYTPVHMFDDLVQKVVYKLWINSGIDMRRFVNSIGDWNLPKDFMDMNAVREAIARLSRTQRDRLIFLLVTCEHGFLPGQDQLEELKKIAKDYASIDYDRLAAEIRMEIGGDEFAGVELVIDD
jgi:hypothetical protein